jgi:hypothetical protein
VVLVSNQMHKTLAKNIELHLSIDEYVDKKEVLRRYKISQRTLSDWHKKKIIPYLRISSNLFRYRLIDIDRALIRHQVKEVA